MKELLYAWLKTALPFAIALGAGFVVGLIVGLMF